MSKTKTIWARKIWQRRPRPFPDKFSIRITGDSMLPRFTEGCRVSFEVCDVMGKIVRGKAYFLQRADGSATFKIIQRADRSGFVLRCSNKKGYPQTWHVPRSDVVRLAMAYEVAYPVVDGPPPHWRPTRAAKKSS